MTRANQPCGPRCLTFSTWTRKTRPRSAAGSELSAPRLFLDVRAKTLRRWRTLRMISRNVRFSTEPHSHIRLADPLWVKTGKAQREQIESAPLSRADICAADGSFPDS